MTRKHTWWWANGCHPATYVTPASPNSSAMGMPSSYESAVLCLVMDPEKTQEALMAAVDLIKAGQVLAAMVEDWLENDTPDRREAVINALEDWKRLGAT